MVIFLQIAFNCLDASISCLLKISSNAERIPGHMERPGMGALLLGALLLAAPEFQSMTGRDHQL